MSKESVSLNTWIPNNGKFPEYISEYILTVFDDGVEWDSDCEKTMEIFERHDCEYIQEATSGNNLNR